MEQLQITAYPHMSDEQARKQIVSAISARLPQREKEPPKSAQEQYEALRARMRGGM